tara:strand:+ start:781 stop:1068 length:288 start_codon:yes stop_codon:yes gene_type:complete
MIDQEIKQETIINGLCNIIRRQFPQIPEGLLMSAVIEQAVADLKAAGDDAYELRKEAAEYLSGYMEPAEMCGVSSDWIRMLVRQSGLHRLGGQRQ